MHKEHISTYCKHESNIVTCIKHGNGLRRSCAPKVCFDHQALVTDETRVAPYAAAIRGVAAGRKVLDIGWWESFGY